MEKLHAIRLKQQSSAPVLAGHPWVFSNAIISDTSQINEVCLVEIFSQDNAFLGIGMFNPRTSIKVRIISKDKNAVIDKEFFEKRLFDWASIISQGQHSAEQLTLSENKEIREQAKIEKGSGEPNKTKVGKITRAQLREIAETKLPDLNTNNLEQAMKIIEGTARNMGVTVE